MIQSIELFYREGSSDKVYKVNISEQGTGFVVNFAYGRRGSALTTGTKTPKPVAIDQAQKVYNKLIQEKTAKGYIEDPNGRPFTGTVTESRDTGFRPQLLNEIEEEDVELYITHPDWCAQEKYDGRRRSFVVQDGVSTPTNRKGLSIASEPNVEAEILKLMGRSNGILDGEDMGKGVMIFDFPVIGMPYKDRYDHLSKLFMNRTMTYIELVATAWTTTEKRALYKKLKKDNAEGIVFKNIKAGFMPGRPNSGGDQLKFKFCATATVHVMGVNKTKRSISVAVYDGKEKVEVGNVTVYPNQSIPNPGDIVEVKYLYYFPGGSLFQPVLLGERDDMGLEDCTLEQLKIKRQEVES